MREHSSLTRSAGRRSRRSFVVAVVPALSCLALASTASAASFAVTDPTDAALTNPAGLTCVSTDAGKCTLRAAVQAADNAGGSSTISLAPGTYKLTIPSTGADDPKTGDLDVNNGASLTINGNSAASTIIDANYLDRAFAVQLNSALAISGVTIEHGDQRTTVGSPPSNNSTSAEDGGGFYNDGRLSIDRCVLLDNYSFDDGGAVYDDANATVTSIMNTTGTGNTADDPGAIVYLKTGSLTLSGDTFTNNSAEDDGAAVYDDGGTTVSVTNTGFSDLTAGSNGGALDLNPTGAVQISNSTFTDISADDDDGGAVYDNGSGSLTITGSTFDGDTSGDSNGGAVDSDGPSSLTITNSTFDGDNSGDSDGGAVYDGAGGLTVTGSSFTDNEGEAGGALAIDGGVATDLKTITATKFTDNKATDDEGGAVYAAAGDIQISRDSFGGNLAGDGGGLAYDSGETMAVVNSTFDGNAGAEDGGAIYLDSIPVSPATVTLLSDTLTRNTAYEGGGIYKPADATSIKDAIVAGNYGGTDYDAGEDCDTGSGGPPSDTAGAADQGGNIDSDGSCFSNSVSHDKTGVNPDLGPLAFNGGPTETAALLTGSPALGDGIVGSCPTNDQRGVARPVACDSGAFQTAAADLAVSASAPAKAPAGGPLKFTFRIMDNGPGAATGVVFTDAIPGGSSYYSSSSSQGSCGGTSTVTCTLGAIDSAATSPNGSPGSATVTIVVVPSHAGALKDTGRASSTASDPSAGNNSASATTKVTAPPSLPVAVTGVASQIKSTSAKLSGIVDPENASTKYSFQFGPSKKYGRTAKGKTLRASTSVSSVVVSLKGLKPGKTYHFRIVATNANGTFKGKDVTFKTKKAKPKKRKH